MKDCYIMYNKVQRKGDYRHLHKGVEMRKGVLYKCFVYLLCFAFLSLTGGFPRMASEAKERNLPAGEMICNGEVKFEARENVWKRVEPSHFPIFHDVKFKTEKGQALLALTNGTQVETGQNSLFSLQHDDQFQLFQGRISFRIPSGAHMGFRVGNLFVQKAPSLHAAKTPLVSRGDQETVGSITLHSNGALTLTSIRGSLSIQNQDRGVVAALSSRESMTIPSATVSGEQGVMVAQVGDYPTGEAITEEFLGLSKTTWLLIGLGTVAVAGGAIAIAAGGGDGDHHFLLPPSP
jgi:hypothetical protein